MTFIESRHRRQSHARTPFTDEKRRDRDVQAAMVDYAAEGVSEDYRAKELRWKNAAGEGRGIINTLRSSLERNDESAQDALRKARAAVESIG